MRRFLLILFVALGLCAVPASARAQSRADTAAVLLDAAKQLRTEGQHDAARVLLDLIRRHYNGTNAAGEALSLLGTYANAVQPQASGRVELMVWSTAYGIWLGVATPVVLDAEDPAAFGVGLLAGAPLGFLAARQYLKSHPALTEGQARAITFGGSWGTWQGFGWMQVLGDHTEEFCFPTGGTPPQQCDEFESDPSAKKVIGAMFAGGLAGIGAGTIAARKSINSGVAAAVSSSSLWGTWIGFALSTIARADNGSSDDDVLAATLVGGDAAVVAAGLLAPKWNPSVNRVRLVSLSGLVGGVIGGGLVLIMQPDDENIALSIPLATSIAGLAIGSRLTRDYDRDRAGSQPQRQGSSLLRWENGGVRVGSFEPVPVLRRDMRGAKPRLQPALAVNVFSARF